MQLAQHQQAPFLLLMPDVGLSRDAGDNHVLKVVLVHLQAWVFQPWVKDIIDKRLKELAEAPKPVIAFHVRWGDKIEEDILLVRHLPDSPAMHAFRMCDAIVGVVVA